MWSLYTKMGDRNASFEGEELHNNSPILTNLQQFQLEVYSNEPWFHMYKYGYNHFIFSMKQGLNFICNVL